MTPAVEALRRAGVEHTLHRYESAGQGDWGMEAARALGVPAEHIFKTLIVAPVGSKRLATAIAPVNAQLDLKATARALGARKVAMADPQVVTRATGYAPGGVSPLGQKQRLPTLLDASAQKLTSIHVSAGRRGLEIELAPDALLALTDGSYCQLRAGA